MRCGWERGGTGIFLCIRPVRVGCWWRLSAGVPSDAVVGDPYGRGRGDGCAGRVRWRRCAGGGGGGAAGAERFGAAGGGGSAAARGRGMAAGGLGGGGGGAWAGVVYRGAGRVE